MCYIFVQMVFPVFHEFDADGTIRTNGLHWDGFLRIAWEALSAVGYTTHRLTRCPISSVWVFPVAG
jgi:hypothetical protein